MSRLPRVTARQMLSILQRAGFLVERVRGSHFYLRHENDHDRTTAVSLHPGDLPRGTMLAILKQAGISREEFLRLL